MKNKAATILSIDIWGKKRLAYLIEKQKYGTYVKLQFSGSGDCIQKLEMELQHNANILSYLTTTISKSNVASGTNLYWSISGSGIDSSDFTVSPYNNLTGFDDDDSFTIYHKLANDLITEGDETLYIKLYSDSDRTTQVGDTAIVNILDTSKTAIYSFDSISTKNEGDTVYFTGTTTGVADGTTVYFKIT